ncbi:helix-turn-helix domain-containing protein [Streptosporangium vulgare]|uniref:TetR/AcrR family transcriptional regulator n=1 Tax=Streptosporangium vulgare TaxID=46190 RepID=UPI0031D05041
MATTKNSNSPSGDRRVRRTHTALARALIELVEERDLSRITVADVAERAGVSRSTFYDHYRDVHELAEAACTAMIDGLIESLPRPRPGDGGPGAGGDPVAGGVLRQPRRARRALPHPAGTAGQRTRRRPHPPPHRRDRLRPPPPDRRR